MQVKKEYMHRAIVEAAIEEFAEKGYTKGSLRRIAEAADTKMSNIYNYFRSKEDLFGYLVGNFYVEVQTLFAGLVRAGDGISVAEIGAEESSRRWSEILLPLVDRRAELLITAADGTRYAGFRSELEQRLLSAVGLMCGWYPVQPNPDGYPVNLYVSTYIDAAVYLSRRYAKKKSDAHAAVENLLKTALAGFAAVSAEHGKKEE